MRSFKVRNQWLRDALDDGGMTQRELAKLWDVNEPQVSRYIVRDESELTMNRAATLGWLFGRSLEEILARQVQTEWAISPA